MILTIGGTGSVGMSATRRLTEKKAKVAAMVRDIGSDKAKELASGGVCLVSGDLKERKTLDAALNKVETVVCTASSTMSRREGDSIETVDQEGLQNLTRRLRGRQC